MMLNLLLCIILLPIGQIPQFPVKGPTIPTPEKIPVNQLQLIFMYLEVLDIRECRYTLANAKDFENDFKMIMARYADLKDAPPLNMYLAFPNRDIATEFKVFNRKYQVHLEALKELYPYDGRIDAIIAENKFLYKIWDDVSDISVEYYYVHVRKQALKRLRESLDKIDSTYFYKGILPDPVPTYRFVYIR